MRASDIEARAVAKVVLVALFYAALALLLVIVILHTRTTLRWIATALFLALALDPAVGLLERIKIRGHPLPRVAAILAIYVVFFAALVFLVLHVLPPIVRDIEGLAKNGELHPMQAAFHENHGLQCGFCTPGMIMTAVDMVNRLGKNLDEATVRHELEGNLCRCTGYHNIVKSIQAGAARM